MNKFKRILLASGLAATASLMANSPAFAQSTNATVNLSGSIPYALEMTVNPITAAAGSLDLSVGGRTVKIATITGASTNSENGLKVGITKTPMTSSTGGTVFFSVRDAAGANADTTANITGADLTADTGELNYTKSNARGSAPDSSIFIFYNVYSETPPGTYTGSVTFTVINR
jgi:hypothetical protein